MDKESTKRNSGKIVQSNNFGVSLAELIYRFRLRYRAEMADLELADWLETLNQYDIREVREAMDYLLHNPPKQVLPDGTMQEWRGFPTLLDVTQTIGIVRELRVIEFHRAEAERDAQRMKELAKEREKHPEKFMSWEEFKERLTKENPELAARANLIGEK